MCYDLSWPLPRTRGRVCPWACEGRTTLGLARGESTPRSRSTATEFVEKSRKRRGSVLDMCGKTCIISGVRRTRDIVGRPEDGVRVSGGRHAPLSLEALTAHTTKTDLHGDERRGVRGQQERAGRASLPSGSLVLTGPFGNSCSSARAISEAEEHVSEEYSVARLPDFEPWGKPTLTDAIRRIPIPPKRWADLVALAIGVAGLAYIGVNDATDWKPYVAVLLLAATWRLSGTAKESPATNAPDSQTGTKGAAESGTQRAGETEDRRVEELQ